MGFPLYRSAVRFFTDSEGSIDMNVDGSSTNKSFDLTAPTGQIYTVWSVKFSFVSPWPGSARVDYDKFMDDDALVNGILIQDTMAGEVSFSTYIQNNADLTTLPVAKWDMVYQGTNNALIEVVFDFSADTPLIINDNDGDFNRIVIRDDMEFLTLFRASSRGTVKNT